ncbi:MAG: M56 family metallopeptidase, partial [Massilia sp.]
MNLALLVNSIGWTLLHFLWQGALIGVLCALTLGMLRQARPQWRYIVACASLLACLLWPAVELAMCLQGDAMQTVQMRFADAMLARRAGNSMGSTLVWLQSQFGSIVALWALCAALLTVRMALGLAWIRRTTREHQHHGACEATLASLARRFGVTRRVGLRVVNDLASPLSVGWLRPLVLVPAALLSGMPPQLLEALLAHEMAHIRRLDYLVNLGQNVIETLLFYHPAVWWISHRIRHEREQIADDLAA